MTHYVVDFGPFALTSLLGEGGMGEVWKGCFRAAGGREVDVAIKLLRGHEGLDEEALESFEREVQAMAALDHPYIVKVLDYGRIGVEGEERSGGRYRAGTPYIVMEQLEGSTIEGRRGVISWAELRESLLAVLSGLAHAHARGVIHRDIKERNILLAHPVKLTDFGIARLLEASDEERTRDEEMIYGTPAVIAPEQIERRWRDQGPWTDLYSLGCVTYALVAGARPFAGRGGAVKTMLAHLHDMPPPLFSVEEMPDGLEDWVLRMMEKDPRKRFRRAADAASALRKLRLTSFTLSEDEPTLGPEGQVPNSSWDSWESELDHQQPMPVAGMGLGLYGLRDLNLVGREQERALLREELERVREERRPRLVVLRGPSGLGKSRLARWICEQGHERGLAEVLEARHSPSSAPSDGIGPMISRFLRCDGLSPSDAFLRVRRHVKDGPQAPSDEAHALRAFLQAPLPELGGLNESTINFTSEREGLVLVERFFARITTDRAAIAWLDDIQWGLETLSFIEHLLETERSELPLLMIATVQEEALSERQHERLLLDELLASPHCTLLEVSRLSEADIRSLLRGLLGLAPTLAARVEERCAGNPLFAIQLVGDWVHRGLLVLGEQGFMMAPGSSSALPADLERVWSDRIEAWLAPRSEADALSLELAAALGREMPTDEWVMLCSIVGCAATPEMVSSLVRSGLARWGEGGRSWAFEHGMLRACLEQRARKSERWSAHNLACAELLRRQSGEPDPARLGRHLVEAGRPEEAIEPLYAGCIRATRSASWGKDQLLLDELHRALLEASIPGEDPRFLDYRVLAARVAINMEDLVFARREIEQAERDAHLSGFRANQAAALHQKGRLVARDAGPLAARPILERALQLFEESGDEVGGLRCSLSLGTVLGRSGELERARQAFRRAMQQVGATDDAHRRVQGFLGLVHAELSGERFDEVERLAQVGLDYAADNGFRLMAAKFQNCLGECARMQGDLKAAMTHYRTTISRFEAIGVRDWAAQLNLGLVFLGEGSIHEARRIFEGFTHRQEAGIRRMALPTALLGLALCEITQGKWAAAEDHVIAAQRILSTTGQRDRDLIILSEQIAERSTQAEQGRLALLAETIAENQQRGL